MRGTNPTMVLLHAQVPPADDAGEQSALLSPAAPTTASVNLAIDRYTNTARPQPPVIASQHKATGIQLPPPPTSRRPIEPTQPSAMSPPFRPAKRMRAGSDTSLVLKTARFAVSVEDDARLIPPPASALLPAPPRNLQAVSQNKGQDRQQYTTNDSRVYHTAADKKEPASPWQQASTHTTVNEDSHTGNGGGSAPITPPLSSN